MTHLVDGSMASLCLINLSKVRMSRYSKRHYEDMARIIYDGQEYASEWGGAVAAVAIESVKRSIIQMFEADNDKFDRKKFNAACNGFGRRELYSSEKLPKQEG